MRCSECGADMPPLREFCPACGTPTSAGLRRREPGAPGGRTPEELRHNRKTVLIACAAIAAVAVAGRLSWPFPSPVHIDLHEPPRGPVATNADELVRAYAADPAAAAKRFDGREIMVSGEFLRIVPDGYGSIDMRLKTPNPDAPLGADLAGASVEDAKLLRPGQQVTVSCRRVAGSDEERWLQECAIQPVGGAAPPPSPPAPPPPRAAVSRAVRTFRAGLSAPPGPRRIGRETKFAKRRFGDGNAAPAALQRVCERGGLQALWPRRGQ